MYNHRQLFLGVLLTSALGAGCTHHVYSPPGRFMPLESPATLADGETAVAAEVGAAADLFGPQIVGVGARARHGIGGEWDLSLEAAAAFMDDEDLAEGVETHRGLYLARVGAKFAPELLEQHLALTFGVGGGGYTGGGFIAPDAGFILGYENRYVVPFIGYSAGLSVPILAREVDTSSHDQSPGTHTNVPQLTFTQRVTLGLRAPVRFAGELPGSVTIGLQSVRLHDLKSGEDSTFVGPGAHLEFVF